MTFVWFVADCMSFIRRSECKSKVNNGLKVSVVVFFYLSRSGSTREGCADYTDISLQSLTRYCSGNDSQHLISLSDVK